MSRVEQNDGSGWETCGFGYEHITQEMAESLLKKLRKWNKEDRTEIKYRIRSGVNL